VNKTQLELHADYFYNEQLSKSLFSDQISLYPTIVSALPVIGSWEESFRHVEMRNYAEIGFAVGLNGLFYDYIYKHVHVDTIVTFEPKYEQMIVYPNGEQSFFQFVGAIGFNIESQLQFTHEFTGVFRIADLPDHDKVAELTEMHYQRFLESFNRFYTHLPTIGREFFNN
jgi:hypothetical protein